MWARILRDSHHHGPTWARLFMMRRPDLSTVFAFDCGSSSQSAKTWRLWMHTHVQHAQAWSSPPPSPPLLRCRRHLCRSDRHFSALSISLNVKPQVESLWSERSEAGSTHAHNVVFVFLLCPVALLFTRLRRLPLSQLFTSSNLLHIPEQLALAI